MRHPWVVSYMIKDDEMFPARTIHASLFIGDDDRDLVITCTCRIV